VETVMLDPSAVDEHAVRIERDGFTVLHGLDAALTDAVLLEIERTERELAVGTGENLFEGFQTKRVYNLLARGKVYAQAVEHESVLAVVERVLDRGFLVSTVSSIAIEPGESAQPIHADDQLVPLPKPHRALTCTVMWAMTDFTEENGATRVIPGSHRRDSGPDMTTQYEAASTSMKRGSALIYNGSLWHGGGANRSSARRVGLAVGYCVGWMRQQENQQLGIPRDIAKTFSPRLRKLVGYGIYKGLYGHIDKCSPVDLLDQCAPRVVVGVVR
jgi:ectoine hydroxylase-related dioxygenase (phytanoyl-CoA dioxygenase family)